VTGVAGVAGVQELQNAQIPLCLSFGNFLFLLEQWSISGLNSRLFALSLARLRGGRVMVLAL
jgi:hypothetical protein